MQPVLNVHVKDMMFSAIRVGDGPDRVGNYNEPRKSNFDAVTVDDLGHSDQLFTTLMGDAVQERREFIQSNACQ